MLLGLDSISCFTKSVTLRIIWRNSFGIKWRIRSSPKSQCGAICFGTLIVARVAEHKRAGFQVLQFSFNRRLQSVPETLVCGTLPLRQIASKLSRQIIRKVTTWLSLSPAPLTAVRFMSMTVTILDLSCPTVSAHVGSRTIIERAAKEAPFDIDRR